MATPGMKKPVSSLTQNWNETCDEAIKDLMDSSYMDPDIPWDEAMGRLDSIIEEALRRNDLKLPFYKRWCLWYRHWKLKRRYKECQRK